MSYYEDLSCYSYHKLESGANTWNVGWLDKHHPFPQRTGARGLLPILKEFCRTPVFQTRGLHFCEFCVDQTLVEMNIGDKVFYLGSSEIRVFGPGLNVYAAPNLVYHYIEAHNYLPPLDFVQALTEGPQPASESYLTRLQGISAGSI